MREGRRKLYEGEGDEVIEKKEVVSQPLALRSLTVAAVASSG